MIKKNNLSDLNICGAFCISLKNRDDRRALFHREFGQTGLNIEMLLVDKDNESPERGCFESHMTCARLALEKGYQHVLIFEDDATLEPFEPRQIARIRNFMTRKAPELFYLGANLGKVWLTWSPGVARVRAKGSHAYILSAAGCRKLLAQAPYTGVPIDRVLSKAFKGYIAFPMLSQQQPTCISSSDMPPTAPGTPTQGADMHFWQRNWRTQYIQALRNLGKTLALRDL